VTHLPLAAESEARWQLLAALFGVLAIAAAAYLVFHFFG